MTAKPHPYTGGAAAGSAILNAWKAGRESARATARPSAQGGAMSVARMHAVPRGLARAFQAAESSRLTAGFQVDVFSLNEDLAGSLRTLVGRSRWQAKNNDYIRKFLRMVQNHVVGPEGFRLHVPCKRPDGTLDALDSAVVEGGFTAWARKGVCDVTGRLSFRALCRLLMLCVARDGEALVRRVRRPGINAWGYALQVIDPVLLDVTYRVDLPGGNRIRMGVEFDADGAAVAYHLLTDPDTMGLLGTRRTRVPASDIWHLYQMDEPTQLRGVPWAHTAMRRLNDLAGYEQAAVIAARIGASKMGFYTQTVNEQGSPINAEQLADGQDGEPDDPMADLIKEAEPGAFELLPEGVDFKSFNPDYPHQNFDVFVKACLRGASSGLDVDYNSIANDLEGVNYSSIRHGMLETRESWTNLQNWFKEVFLEPLYTEWLGMAFLSGQLGSLPISKFAKYDCGQWQGRRWQWVDPRSDTQAKLLEINNGLASYSGYIRERGLDPEAVWRELESDKKRIAALLNPGGRIDMPLDTVPKVEE